MLDKLPRSVKGAALFITALSVQLKKLLSGVPLALNVTTLDVSLAANPGSLVSKSAGSTHDRSDWRQKM
ncbi:MAG: hypothetical protein H7240_07040 [Glaciimonas sp.]|nr:hypothetical protein [Glaciimonas sp.]